MLDLSPRSSNLTAQSSARWTVSSCRSNLIMNFDTSKQSWLNFAGSMSVHFRSRQGWDTRDNFKVGVGRNLTFTTSFLVPLFSTLATRLSCDFSVTYLLIPFTIRTQETVVSSKWWFDHDLHTLTSLMMTEPSHPGLGRSSYLHGSTSHVGWFLTSRWSMLSTWPFHVVECLIIKCNEEFFFLNVLWETQHWCRVSSISLAQEVLQISVTHTTSFLVLRHQSAKKGQQSEILSVEPLIPNFHLRRVSPHLVSLWLVLHTNPPLLRRHWVHRRK